MGKIDCSDGSIQKSLLSRVTEQSKCRERMMYFKGLFSSFERSMPLAGNFYGLLR